MDIWDVRNYIGQGCLDFVRYGKGNLIFNTFTGSGKTTTILKTIYEAPDGFTWMYFAPYHKVIEENIELSDVIDFHNWIHLESRAKVCLSKTFRKLAESHINIQPFCDSHCTLRDTKCPYYENLRKLREMPTCFAGVHAHIPTLLQTLLYEKWNKRCMFNYYDVIIIDEFPLSTVYNQISITKKDIDYCRDVLELLQINNNESYVLMLMLNELSLATDNIGINYNKLKEIMSIRKGIDFDKFKEQYDSKILDLIRKKQILSPPKDIVHCLATIHKKNPTVQDLFWMIHKTKNNQWHKGMIHLSYSNADYFRTLPVKVIALDGTANLPTWKTILGEDSTSISFDIEFKNTYQLIGARNPVSTIIKDNKFTSSGKKLFELLKIICENKKGKVLICATQRIQKILKKKLKKEGITNYIFATFFNLRSRNSYYENCDTCVVFHEPNIPPFQVEIIKNVLGWDENIVIKVHREDEIKQAIGRLRQNIPITPSGRKREKREIYIFSSTGFQKLVPEAEYMLYDDILGFVKGGKKRIFFDKLKKILEKHCPISKTKLNSLLGISKRKFEHVINVLEEEGILEISWGKVEYVKQIKEEDEEKYLIRIGRAGW